MSEKFDWLAIKNEYVNSNISYRKIAEKYDISFQTLRDKAVKEKWFEKKKEQRNKIGTKTEQKTAEKLATAEANRILRINSAADKLLVKIEEATEQLDQFIVTNKVKEKEVQYVSAKAGFGKPKKEVVREEETKTVVKADHLDKAGLKQLTSALKDLKEITLSNEVKDDNTAETADNGFLEALNSKSAEAWNDDEKESQ